MLESKNLYRTDKYNLITAHVKRQVLVDCKFMNSIFDCPAKGANFIFKCVNKV